jgi:hypothetical protein
VAEIRRTTGALKYQLTNEQNNDVVILKLKTAITATNAKPACLADADPTDGDVLYVSGWGTTSSGNLFPFIQDQLFKVSTQTLDISLFKGYYIISLITAKKVI